MTTVPAAKVERWQRFRDNRNQALAARHGWLTLTSFQWLEDSPAAVELAPGLWSTDGTTASLTAVPGDGLSLVETGEAVSGTITAALALSAPGSTLGTSRTGCFTAPAPAFHTTFSLSAFQRGKP